MVKHRRWSDKQESEPTPKEDIESISKQENTPLKIETDLKSLLLSGTKYIYIVAAAALFSGIFTPLTIGAEFESVITGILSILLGLGGGIVLVIFLGLSYMILNTPWLQNSAVEPEETIKQIGNLLMIDYLLPFEVASILLLAALIGAALLSRSSK